jgi:hypothetical protein
VEFQAQSENQRSRQPGLWDRSTVKAITTWCLIIFGNAHRLTHTIMEDPNHINEPLLRPVLKSSITTSPPKLWLHFTFPPFGHISANICVLRSSTRYSLSFTCGFNSSAILVFERSVLSFRRIAISNFKWSPALVTLRRRLYLLSHISKVR